ncbi:MAG: malonyl-CoA decarboxylase family protein [Proteobacteria bacterium]|nr:malonyl-CoA decarboxylase family protein [Pseudomonadota bacterium]MDA1355913.1 malonyl-CoA decarboxylase family protein [Pseudomonadota bacterium]
MNAGNSSGALVDRTLTNIRNAWREMTDSARVALTGSVRPDLPPEDLERIERQVTACLEGRGGEVSARTRAADLGRTYLSLDPTGRKRFLKLLARFGVNDLILDEAAEALLAAPDLIGREVASRRLKTALVAPRTNLLRQFSALPNGVKFLVDMRAELREIKGDDADLAALDADLKDLLSSWFDIGLLNLQRITWNAPAALLEKLADYEAVHAILSWQDLKHRLDSTDRRFYAFFHPNMAEEPLIFVEVALVEGLAGNVQELLDVSEPRNAIKSADTAIFYSISNAQRGLNGISFGGFLIKRVLDDVTRELPAIKTAATLSPMPGFRKWLEDLIETDSQSVLTTAEHRALKGVAGDRLDDGEGLSTLLASPWQSDKKVVEALRQPLTRLGATYLLTARDSFDEPSDRVARFHLSNGARVERLNFLADSSLQGMKQSYGMMVNYRYKPGDIEANHEAFKGAKRIVASSAVKSLLSRRER